MMHTDSLNSSKYIERRSMKMAVRMENCNITFYISAQDNRKVKGSKTFKLRQC